MQPGLKVTEQTEDTQARNQLAYCEQKVKKLREL